MNHARVASGPRTVYLVGLINGLSAGYISMSTTNPSKDNAWTKVWLDSVANGASTMSQRKVGSIEKRGGGLETVRREAVKRGVHLVRLEDDKGNDLIAASRQPFKVIA